jgi:hypothetical protein
VGLGFVTIAAASGPSWTDIVTAIGTVFAGLALPLAFVQLGALRRDRLREQVSKVGAWVGTVEQTGEETWAIPALIRNGSELPIRVNAVDLAVWSVGVGRVLVGREGTNEFGYPRDTKYDRRYPAVFPPGSVVPGDTWSFEFHYPQTIPSQPEAPVAAIMRVVIGDAAGYQWEIRSTKAGPARRVRRWRRRWWILRGIYRSCGAAADGADLKETLCLGFEVLVRLFQFRLLFCEGSAFGGAGRSHGLGGGRGTGES